jgi:hypothetical protein
MSANPDRTSFLRRSLQLDGVASGLCGVLLLAAASPIAPVIGLADPQVARVVGALLVVYAAALLWNGARATVSRAEAVAGPLTLIGNLAVAAVAAAVLLFAVLEVVGLTRLREAPG